jgi:hypothetical protein
MKGLRIVFGGAILLLLVVPLFAGVILATGVTQAIFGDDFLAGIHDTVIEAVPGLVEDSFAAAQESGAVQDPIARRWVKAAAAAGQTPSQFFAEIGVYKWLQEELGQTIDGIGEALRGEKDPAEVVLNMKPLKEALTSTAARNYFQSILDRLPICDHDELERWKGLVLHDRRNTLPACNPGTPIPAGALELMMARVTDVPNTIPVLEDARMPWGTDYIRLAGRLVWLAFLLPIILLLVGGGIAAVSRAAFLGWTGITLIIGGAIPLFATAVIEEVVVAGLKIDPSHWDYLARSPFWTTKASHAMAARIADIAGEVVSQLLDPVGTVAMTVAGIGLFILVLAFIAPGSKNS